MFYCHSFSILIYFIGIDIAKVAETAKDKTEIINQNMNWMLSIIP